MWLHLIIAYSIAAMVIIIRFSDFKSLVFLSVVLNPTVAPSSWSLHVPKRSPGKIAHRRT